MISRIGLKSSSHRSTGTQFPWEQHRSEACGLLGQKMLEELSMVGLSQNARTGRQEHQEVQATHSYTLSSGLSWAM